MRTRILALALFLALAGHFARGQTTQTLSAANQCTAPIDVTGYGSLGIQVTGTWSATLQPEVAIGGRPAVNAQVVPSTSSTAQSTITANGAYIAAVAGYTSFLVCATTYASGTATITFQGNKNLNARLFGAGSGVAPNQGPMFSAHFVDHPSDPLLSPVGGEVLTAFGTTWYDGATYHQYYCYQITAKYVIGHATSPDGIVWTKDSVNNPVLSAGTVGNWDASDVCVPVVWKEGSTWFMMYRGDGVGTTQAIGFATSPDGLVWTRTPNNKCIAPNNVGNGCVLLETLPGDPYGIIKIGSTYYLGESDTSGGASRAAGIATSTDLINWTNDPANPLFTGGRFCGGYFKVGGYYYTIIPHYIAGAITNAELELYRSATFPPYPSVRTYLGVIKQQPGGVGSGTGSWNSFALDTAEVLTDDITRSTYNVTGGDIWMYYSGTADSGHTNFYEGLAIAAQGIQAPADTMPAIPNGGYLIGPLNVMPGTSGSSTTTIANGGPIGVTSTGVYYGGIYAASDGTNFKLELAPGTKVLEIASDSFIRWSSTVAAGGAADSSLYRVAAGVVGFGAGTAAASAGFAQLGTTVVASLPAAAAGNKGQMIYVSDSTTVSAEGQTCVGSSTFAALAFSNGTVWKCF